MQKKDYYYEYAKSLLNKPTEKVEAELNLIRKVYGDAEADAIVSKFSAGMREVQKIKLKEFSL